MKRGTCSKWIAIALLFIAGLVGCYDYSKFDNISVDPISPKIVAPVLNSKISFKELAERDDANTVVIQKPGDTKFYLAFRDTIEVGVAATQFTIPPVVFAQDLHLNVGEIPAIPLTEPLTINRNFSETYAPIAGSEIKSILLTQGMLTIQVDNQFNKQVDIKLELTSLKNTQGNSVMFERTIDNMGTSNESIDLNGYTISLFDGVSAYNTFAFEVELTIHPNGQPITAADYAGIQISFNNLDFSYVVGKFNQSIFVDDYDYKVDIFRSTYIADQHLDEPKLKLKFINGYGVPFSFNVNNFEVTNTTSNEVVFLMNEGTPTDSTLLIGSANDINYVKNIGDNPAQDSLVLFNGNSNIEDIFDIAPNQFKLRSGITLGDNTSNHNYFINKNANLSVISEIELPLVGWVETNQINDTIVDIEFPDLEEELNLKDNDSLKITVKFKFNNNIPLDAYFQAYFLNDMDQELTKLLDQELWLIQSAAVDPISGKAIAPKQSYSEIVVNRKKYALMKDATKVVLQVRFKTGGTTHQTVVIENTNAIDIQMSVNAEGTYNFDL